MFCTKCGKEIADKACFCTYCGSSTNNRQSSQIVNNHIKRPKIRSSWVVLAVIAIGIGVVLIFGRKSRDRVETSEKAIEHNWKEVAWLDIAKSYCEAKSEKRELDKSLNDLKNMWIDVKNQIKDSVIDGLKTAVTVSEDCASVDSDLVEHDNFGATNALLSDKEVKSSEKGSDGAHKEIK